MKTKFTSLVLALVSALMFTSCGDSRDKVIDDTIDHMEEVAEAFKDGDKDKLKELEEKKKELDERMKELDFNLQDHEDSLSEDQKERLEAAKKKLLEAAFTEASKELIQDGKLEKRDEARVQSTREDFTTLITHLDQYRNIGRNGYPTEPQGLEALIKKPGSSPIPRDWVQSLPEMPKDPWGNPYTYKFPGSKKPNEPELISNGPDGVSGNEDDLSSQDYSERTFQDSEKRTSENSKPQISHEEKDSSVTIFEQIKREPKLSLEAEALKAELENGLDPDSFKEKTSLLGIAIKEDDYSRAWILLNNGADPEMPTGKWNDMLPLQLAASERNVAICALLLSKGVDPNGTGKNYRRPVEIPFGNGGANRDETREIFDLLLQKDVDLTYRCADGGNEQNWTGFVCEAVKSKNPYFLRVALDQGAPLNLECFKPSQFRGGSGNLIYKAVKEHGEIEVIQLYVNKIQSESQIAIEVNERGETSPYVNRNGNTPLLEAISKKRPKELIKYLISIGADPKNTNEAGWNALHQSSSVGDLALFKDFLDTGLDIDSPDKWGKSPLMYAVEREDYQTVKGLLKLGADTAQKDSEGKSALDLAREKANNPIIKLLESSKQLQPGPTRAIVSEGEKDIREDHEASDVKRKGAEPKPFDHAQFRAKKAEIALKDRREREAPGRVFEAVAEEPKLTHEQRLLNALKEYKDVVDKSVEKVGLSVWCPSVAEFEGLSQPQQEVLKLMKYVSTTEEAKKLRTSIEKKYNIEEILYTTIQFELWGNVKDRCRAINKYSKMGPLMEYTGAQLERDWKNTQGAVLKYWPDVATRCDIQWDRALITGHPQISDDEKYEQRTLFVPYVTTGLNNTSKGLYGAFEFVINLVDDEHVSFADLSPGRGQLGRGRGVMTHVDVLGYILESHQ